MGRTALTSCSCGRSVGSSGDVKAVSATVRQVKSRRGLTGTEAIPACRQGSGSQGWVDVLGCSLGKPSKSAALAAVARLYSSCVRGQHMVSRPSAHMLWEMEMGQRGNMLGHAPSGPSSTSKPSRSCAKLGVGPDSAPSSSWNTRSALHGIGLYHPRGVVRRASGRAPYSL